MNLALTLEKNLVVFVSAHYERALGLPYAMPGLYGITLASDYARAAAHARNDIFFIESNELLSTRELLEHPRTAEIMREIEIRHNAAPAILVFKNNSAIERICETRGWRLLNTKNSLTNTIEEKIPQIEWLGDLAGLLPPYTTGPLKNLSFTGERFVVQFNHSHSGEGTHLISSGEDLSRLAEKFPEREVRTLAYIEGPTFTNNNIVTDSGVLLGNISYQITGIAPFTDKPFASVGNDWGFARAQLSSKEYADFLDIARRVGEKMRSAGYRGAYGIDAVLEESTGKWYLLEINARQPSSVPTETYLQIKSGSDGVSIFEAHLSALLGVDIPAPLTEIRIGAQLIARKNTSLLKLPTGAENALREIAIFVAPAEARDNGDELVRVRFDKSVIENHKQLNELGARTASILSSHIQNSHRLSPAAESVINNYLHLRIGTQTIPCPYFNNRTSRVRGALRVLIGKGSPQDIEQEAVLLGLKEKIDVSALPPSAAKQFLTEHNLGVDCSAFAYYVLSAELSARGLPSLRTLLKFPYTKTLIRKLLARMRTVENCSVSTLAHDSNSFEVPMSDIRAGDMIVMLDAKKDESRNHILIADEVRSDNGKKTVRYAHSLRRNAEGKYDHGVRHGVITITDTKKPLIEQEWDETRARALTSDSLEIRRLNAMK